MLWAVPALIRIREEKTVVEAMGSTVISSGIEDCGAPFGQEEQSHS